MLRLGLILSTLILSQPLLAAGTSATNGELKELPGLVIIDQVTLPMFVDAPDAAAIRLWGEYKDGGYQDGAIMPIHETALTLLAIPEKVAHYVKMIKGRRSALKASQDVLLPIGKMVIQVKEGSVALFQTLERNRFVVGDKSSLVCSKARPDGTFCVRLTNIGNLTAPVRGIRVPMEQLAKYNIGYADTDRLMGAVIVRRTTEKNYERDGALTVNAVAKKWVIFDPARGVIVSGNVDMDIREPGAAKPAHWVKP